MADNRVSTLYVEVIDSGTPHNRVSTAYVEVINSGHGPANRVSTMYLEAVCAVNPAVLAPRGPAVLLMGL